MPSLVLVAEEGLLDGCVAGRMVLLGGGRLLAALRKLEEHVLRLGAWVGSDVWRKATPSGEDVLGEIDLWIRVCVVAEAIEVQLGVGGEAVCRKCQAGPRRGRGRGLHVQFMDGVPGNFFHVWLWIGILLSDQIRDDLGCGCGC